MVTRNNIHITDSYKISKKEFKSILEYLREVYTSCEVFNHRSIFSLCMEWTVHNFLYNINIQRDRTKDVDLNYPNKHSLVYNIIGVLTWLFIK